MADADDYRDFSREIQVKEERKLKAKRKRLHTIWMGFGMFGLVGWSVAIPTLLGIMLGIWLDKNCPQHFSWTLTLLFIGLISGCLNAWYWVSSENRKMEEKNEVNNE